MSRVSDLLGAYSAELTIAWRTGLSGGERVWMLPYPPELEREIRAALPRFELATSEAGRGWRQIDITGRFGRWVANHRYAYAFFENPGDLTPAIIDHFASSLVTEIRDELSAASANEVVALVGIASIFPFLRAASVINAIDDAVNGRLLVLFPGLHDLSKHSFRLLDARDGFNYRARVIDPQKEIS